MHGEGTSDATEELPVKIISVQAMVNNEPHAEPHDKSTGLEDFKVFAVKQLPEQTERLELHIFLSRPLTDDETLRIGRLRRGRFDNYHRRDVKPKSPPNKDKESLLRAPAGASAQEVSPSQTPPSRRSE